MNTEMIFWVIITLDLKGDTEIPKYWNTEILNIEMIFWVIITLDLEGGLFEETNSVEEIAFKYAVDHINRLASCISSYIHL